MPVLAEAGTAEAARAGDAVRSVSCADERGSGIVGTPARAACPGAVVAGPVGVWSMVRISAALPRRDSGGDPPLGPPPSGPATGGDGSPRVVSAYHPADGPTGSKLSGASHVLVWRMWPRMGVPVQAQVPDSCNPRRTTDDE